MNGQRVEEARRCLVEIATGTARFDTLALAVQWAEAERKDLEKGDA